jgi:hypothetical protein
MLQTPTGDPAGLGASMRVERLGGPQLALKGVMSGVMSRAYLNMVQPCCLDRRSGAFLRTP